MRLTINEIKLNNFVQLFVFFKKVGKSLIFFYICRLISKINENISLY